MKFYGYRYNSENAASSSLELMDNNALVQFLKENYEAYQIIITDELDQPLLLMRDGVDLFNRLDQFNVSLSEIFDQLRREIVGKSTENHKKPGWERIYDNIGLSPGEIRMRQRAKAACKAARTISDVADLMKGTYFAVEFKSVDENTWYRYFEPSDFTADLLTKDENGEWIEEIQRVQLQPGMKVQHLKSSEDIHTFLLLEPPP